ncbi:3-deoxy-D-manno-octulosonic-acid transferase [Candidatus Kryptonium thompsonii]|jgi:3-deoxy-D-manno-octulosonic-acid transferase|uniref:3-deoxy-D-manno-octulosonic acid transferase n=1 Tax=Candidatus Kryptonium thompsonii TaxID=1633631 RepID=A0A0P1LSH5_9BACT|nr:glycosyltransferase N-terminal domain-containing protein [Candidatus Kryptonium thompsoni]CUS76488.1 3-deoxy-D-manno-octulosonic-acid transferase [Candidatus Kryptonium thompsoni]CUS83170.1 3-deoxy-D-manno-octulosonic-acid transferase [Candidatus Kryptonium thompsoni]CUS83221.1 3-deoxy-D-manno-octulosonic-acid transferase [Candidatus Kryptonium thompsoni]CUS84730.1 3-deoxy-D-manno-octulosonic-acid transferase [Candidatus Kryptonium thompsoni]CUU03143.1 3-deoxy-D-manno-octulosonic-acid trans
MKKAKVILILTLYNLIFVPFLFVLFHILGLFNKKVKKGIEGRKKLFQNLEIKIKEKFNPQKPIFWFHSSSLGEFEQAKPIIAKIKEKVNPNIIVTFFSPSGYEHSKNYALADVISYIPFDSIFNAKRFINLIKSNKTFVFLMKYDIWPNHLYMAKKNNFTLCLANTIVNEEKLTFLRRFFYSTIYELFDHIFLISKDDEKNIQKLNLKNPKILTTGDTRYDQVFSRSQEALKKRIIPENVTKTKDGVRKKIFVVGSSWREDEDVIIPAIIKIQKYQPEILTILVPHEPTEQNIERIEKELESKTSYIRFSKIEKYSDEKVIIVDSVGHLMTLYSYADVAYVGGSFKQGIHNVLEPATYGIPVIYGPKINNSPEAQKLAQIGGGFIVKNEKEFYKILRKLLSDENLKTEAGKKSYELVKLNLGATEKIIEAIGLPI